MAQNANGGLEHGVRLRQYSLPPKYPPTIRDDKPKEEFGFGTVGDQHGIKSSPPARRPRSHSNWAPFGPGMQTMYLGSSPRSCGTGVFLPRIMETDLQPSNKPDGNNYIEKKIDEKLEMKKMEDDMWCSPEFFLPKEWTN